MGYVGYFEGVRVKHWSLGVFRLPQLKSTNDGMFTCLTGITTIAVAWAASSLLSVFCVYAFWIIASSTMCQLHNKNVAQIKLSALPIAILIGLIDSGWIFCWVDSTGFVYSELHKKVKLLWVAYLSFHYPFYSLQSFWTSGTNCENKRGQSRFNWNGKRAGWLYLVKLAM